MLRELLANTLAAFMLIVIVVGAALVAAKLFHLDDTVAGAFGVGCWYVVRLFLKRWQAARAAAAGTDTGNTSRV